MGTINAGRSVSENLEAGHLLTLTVTTTGSAYVRIYRGTTLVDSHTLQNGQSRSYGPYNLDVRFDVSAVGCDVTMIEGESLLDHSIRAYEGTYNFKRSNTNKWRAARGKVQAGISNARVVCCGNSITAGYNATGSTDTNNMASKSYPTQLAQILTLRGLNASWQSWFGNNNEVDWGSTGTDSRIVLGSWTNSGLGAFSGNVLNLATTGQTLMSFTPTTQVDTVEVFAIRNSASTRITVAVDGGATLLTYSPGGPAASPPVTHGTSGAIALGSLASHAIQANVSASVSTFLNGMIAYNSAVKEVSVIRAGWQGAVAGSLITAARPWTDGLIAVVPDLTLIAMTRNDATSATDMATFSGYYQQIINAALVSGDVILVIEPMGNALATQYAPYVTAVYQLAASNNLPLIDFTLLWDIYGNISSWYGDGIHPNGFAYGEMARSFAQILMAV